MIKKIAVIALDPEASKFYGCQVQELFGEFAEVRSYSVREGTVSNMERSDLYMISTGAFDNRQDIPQYIPIEAQVSEIHVTYLKKMLEKLQVIPAGTKALFVNMTEKMVREAISGLNQLGINHVKFIPFYPGAELSEIVETAVTPGEERYIPTGIKHVINIGQRCVTPETVIEAALKLELEQLLETSRFQEYCASVATSTYNFDMMFTRTRRLESQFDILMDVLDEGIIGINERTEIFAMNSKAEEITGVRCGLVLHKQISAFMPYLPLLQCIKTREKTEPKVIRINGVNVGVTAVPVLRQNDCIGAFAILQRFNEAENRQNELRSQLMNKGHQAKYTFDDVIGESDEIKQTKSILKAMAQTDSPILLIGDTGTGKELFANAVHLESGRKNGTFVAINCAAMPESLLESELFGYEEGAFTGAKKGGRPGFFEFAHQGTLFLDEVEGMSPALQIKLLRVLQEHELMRVGGHKLINVDVRIIAATNESLEARVKAGEFRRDLYYRLNTLPVLIPPLCARGDDVFLLLQHFRDKMKGQFKLSEEIQEILRSYSWPGNIRELHNLAEYFCFRGSHIITIQDLPPTFQYALQDEIKAVRRDRIIPGVQTNEPLTKKESWEKELNCNGIGSDEYWFVLEVLYKLAEKGETAGRNRILQISRERKLFLSQNEVRTILGVLMESGLAKVKRGRGGSCITPLGCQIWEKHINHF